MESFEIWTKLGFATTNKHIKRNFKTHNLKKTSFRTPLRHGQLRAQSLDDDVMLLF